MTPAMFELKGKVALVTGAGQGVGAEIARLLAARGAAVAVNDLLGERAEQTKKSIAESDGRAHALVADVGDHAAVRSMVSEAERELGPIDILVNNAGLPPNFQLMDFHDTEPEAWEPWIRVNLYGALHCSHAVIGGMRERGWGRIITIVSDAGRTGERRLAVYSATKAGVMGLSRALAAENGERGVTSNCVCLGIIERPDFDPSYDVSATVRRYPIPRLGRATDVAPAVLYLASDEAAWVTGQTLTVDGGYIMS
jgi:3-oxoacyl-[acyl-carrier protein] reductase